MKYILFAIGFLFSITAKAQTAGDSAISVTMPVRAVILMGSYLSEAPRWEDRKAPDQLISKIGSGSQLDSLTSLTITGKRLAWFMNRLQADQNVVIIDDYRQIILNMPSLAGYTGLQAQVNAIANGAGPQKNVGAYVKQAFLDYKAALDAVRTERYNIGLSWLRN